MNRSEHDAVANDHGPSVASQMEFHFKFLVVSLASQSTTVSLDYPIFASNFANAQLSPHRIRLLVSGLPFIFDQSDGYVHELSPMQLVS